MDDVLFSNCAAQGGRFEAYTLCQDLDPPCGEILGACCDPETGICTELTEEVCNDAGFDYQGYFTTCDNFTCPPPNDYCENAISVAVPSNTKGSVLGSTADDVPVCCMSPSQIGVWYSVIGTGNTITASTCDPYTNYDTGINVFCSDSEDACLEPVYVGGGNDHQVDCPYGPWTPTDLGITSVHSRFHWCSEEGAEYLILINGFYNWYDPGAVADFQLNIWDDGTPCGNPRECIPCEVVCPPEGIDEGEPVCEFGYIDTYNGGCNWPGLNFQPINIGDVICGTSGSYMYPPLRLNDYDWYEVVLTDEALLFWTVEAEFDVRISIMHPGSGYCSDHEVIASAEATICTPVSVSASVPAGTYWLSVRPVFNTYPECGVKYTAIAEIGESPAGACCVGSECVATNTYYECDALGGTWFEGESCEMFECPEPMEVTCADGSIWDNGVFDSFAAFRPFENWDPLGIIDDFQLDEPTSVSCIRVEFGEGTTPLYALSDIMSIRARIYNLPGGSINNLDWATDSDNPVFDYVYTKAAGELDETLTGEILEGFDLVYFDLCGERINLDAGSYGLFLTFPGRVAPVEGPDDFFWASADNTPENDGSAIWGPTWNPPIPGFTFGYGFYELAFHLGTGTCYGPGYAYLPGDVNMALGIWPPTVIGGDVTYLVGYFIGGGQASCLMDDFWASADINGDCLIIGGDVTALVGYFIAGGDLVPCPDYEPLWPPVPEEAPDNWPNCDIPVINSRVIPTGSVK